MYVSAASYAHCRRGSVEPFTLIEGPEAWYASEYNGRSDWINHLTQQHIAELDAAITGVERKGINEIHVSMLKEQRLASHKPAAVCRMEQTLAFQ